MSDTTRIVAIGAFVAGFLALKVYFLFHTPKALAWAAVPAFLLILSEPSEAGAKSSR